MEESSISVLLGRNMIANKYKINRMHIENYWFLCII